MMWLWSVSALAGPALERDWVVYADIIGGAASGGNGYALTPGGEPIPIDPHDFIPGENIGVVVIYYDGPRVRDTLVADIERALAAEPIPYPSRPLRIEEITRLSDQFALVTVADELAAVNWLSANRKAVDATDQLSVLFIDRKGPAADALARW